MTDTEDRDRIEWALRKAATQFQWEYGVTSIDGATKAILPLLAEARQQGAREAVGRVIGYMILNPNTDEPDWDGALRLTEESAIQSLTGHYDSFCRTEAERTDDQQPWWEAYEIHPVLEGVRDKHIARQEGER